MDTFWDNIDLDLTGATLINFSLRHRTGGSAAFGSATFTGHADFASATFTCEASFWSATFTGYASFLSATFTGSADFASACFALEVPAEVAPFLAPAGGDPAANSPGNRWSCVFDRDEFGSVDDCS